MRRCTLLAASCLRSSRLMLFSCLAYAVVSSQTPSMQPLFRCVSVGGRRVPDCHMMSGRCMCMPAFRAASLTQRLTQSLSHCHHHAVLACLAVQQTHVSTQQHGWQCSFCTACTESKGVNLQSRMKVICSCHRDMQFACLCLHIQCKFSQPPGKKISLAGGDDAAATAATSVASPLTVAAATAGPA